MLNALRPALAGAPGRLLLDVGGGTGNYAAALRKECWDPLVVDVSEPMLAHAQSKGLAAPSSGLLVHTWGADERAWPGR